MTMYRDLDALARAVLEVDEKVKDHLEAAAILEAIGVTPRVAKELGYSDTFELAKEVMKIIDYYRLTLGEILIEEKPTKLQKMMEAVKLFISGVFFSAPWLLITISYMLFGISLLPEYEEPLRATAIDIALILSIVITSILPPIFMRKLQFHFYQEDYATSQKILMLYYVIGVLTISGSSIIIWFIFKFLPYPEWWTIYTLIYYIPFSFFWLSVAPLYSFQKYFALASSYVVSLLFIGVMYRIIEIRLSLHLIHVYGIMLGAFFAIMYSTSMLYIRYKVLGVTSEPTISPRLSFIIYSGLSYSLIGALYFIFLFTDRILVWSMTNAPYPLLANIDYEKAANLSLLVLIIPFGVINYYLTKIYEEILKEGDKFTVKEIEKYRSKIAQRYRSACLMIFGSGIGSLISLFYLLKSLGWIPTNFHATVFLFSGVSYALIPLFFIGWLLGTFLYKPEFFVKPLILGLSMNVILGFILTRYMGVEYASLSFMVSTIALTITSLWQSLKIVKEVDYAYYSAF